MALKKIKNHYLNVFKKLTMGVSGLFALPAARKLEKQFDNLVDETPSVYDRKIDEIYNSTHIGGGYHRHFDESHSPILMWEKVKETSSDDSLTTEMQNYIVSLFKDMQTINGIPLFNINNKQSFDLFASHLSTTYSIPKSWLMDFMSVNVAEVFTSTIGALALFYGWNKNEKIEFKSEIASSLTLSSLIAANPLLLVFSLISLGRTYTQKKSKKEMNKGALTGLATTGSFLITANLFASPLIGIILGFAVAVTIRRNIKKYKTKDLIPEIKKLTQKHKEFLVGAGIGAAFVALTGM